jgi:hypothetical protein
MPVYSPDRVTRLRLVLVVVCALGTLLMLLAATILFDDATDPAGIAGSTVAVLLLVSGGVTFLLLNDAERPGKIGAIVTGVLCLLSALALAGSWLAFLLPLVGLGLVFLALIPDEVDS